ncbi:MAG: hypothetical protein BMS9Abin12_1311 [Acidimicrobiia bacterium]|nr:MAG: hypothetical protein BMS9Abin12_1311 [Acidimicrobiia bacterium]
MTENPTYASTAVGQERDLYKSLVRLVAGGVGEGIDRFRSLAAELESADHDPESVEVVAVVANPATMVLVGWASEWPERLRSVGSTARQMSYPVTQLVGIAYNTGAVVAEAAGISGIVSSLTKPARQALAHELDRLSKVGTAEYARGRVLSVQAFERSVDGIIGYLGDSDELGDLVREQTLGITGAAVQEIRETGAAADGLTEGIFRKLFGREGRSLPPVPTAEHS